VVGTCDTEDFDRKLWGEGLTWEVILWPEGKDIQQYNLFITAKTVFNVLMILNNECESFLKSTPPRLHEHIHVT
jgi:hypothetical protein